MKPGRIYHGHRLRTHRRNTPGGILGITKCLQPRRPEIDSQIAALVISSFRFSVDKWEVGIGSYVVMPDHFHVLVGLPDTLVLRDWMRRVMDFAGRKSQAELVVRGTQWQQDFHDREVRTKREHDYLIDYYHFNPVRAGLVRSREDWAFSSVHKPSWVGPLWR